MTKRGPAVRHAPVVPRAAVAGYGNRYTVAHSKDPGRIQLFDQDGGRVYPERDGTFAMQHPDDADPPIIAFLSAREVHEAGWGRPVTGGLTITRSDAVYDSRGERVKPTTTTVGWSRHPVPAIKIGDALIPVSDLHESAWGRGASIDPGRVPGHQSSSE